MLVHSLEARRTASETVDGLVTAMGHVGAVLDRASPDTRTSFASLVDNQELSRLSPLSIH
jgi:hypothetical protein